MCVPYIRPPLRLRATGLGLTKTSNSCGYKPHLPGQGDIWKNLLLQVLNHRQQVLDTDA